MHGKGFEQSEFVRHQFVWQLRLHMPWPPLDIFRGMRSNSEA